MNNITNFDRQPNESEFTWKRRVRKYISANAPIEKRYYVRGGTPGRKWERWFIPSLFVGIGIFFIFSSFAIGSDARELNGPNGRTGEFKVAALQQSYTKKSEKPEFTPVIVIRNQQIVPLFSQPNKNTYRVGDVVEVRYSQTGAVKAAFTNEDGRVSNPAVPVGASFGVLFVAIGLLVGKFYRGAVDDEYVASEFERLTGGRIN